MRNATISRISSESEIVHQRAVYTSKLLGEMDMEVSGTAVGFLSTLSTGVDWFRRTSAAIWPSEKVKVLKAIDSVGSRIIG